MDIGDWLRGLGLGQYESTFRDNAVDSDILSELTEGDFEKLGIPLGHRKRILRAIVGSSAVTSSTAADRSDAEAGERRQVTVMFCDLVGSTAMSARLDPEDMRAIIGAYHRCCAALVEEHDGFLAKYMGDGVLAYFGYPHAHEHDAERAVQSGLALVATVPKLVNETGPPLQVRIGIATGLVVVGDIVGSGDAKERGIVGDTPNLAARLQGLAEPGMVVVSESTRRLVGNLFELRDLGSKELKGIEGPVRAWAPLRGSGVASRFEALQAGSLTALVGRDEEEELLMRRWSKASAAEGQVVLISGEAGIGKSRLAAAMVERLTGVAHTQRRYFCSPQHTDSVLHPVIIQLARSAELAHDDPPSLRLDKLDAFLAQTATGPEDAALLAELLSLPNDGRYPALKLTPQQRRQRTLQALIAQMEVLANQSPLLMIFEDAHWTDPTSLELLGRAVDRIAEVPALLIVTSRPEFSPPWIGRPHVTALVLSRLAKRQIDAMIDGVAGSAALPANIRQDIIERTDGIPLFVEEMTKAVIEAESESGTPRSGASAPSSALAVPASLHASLMARLDRLGPGKEVAQIGAVIGREFEHALLAAVALKPEPELNAALDRVIQAGLISREGVPPHATYLFKHALMQDAAYGIFLREPRRALHARIAKALESRFPEIAEGAPEILAHHWSRADLFELAAVQFERAGDRAVARSAYAEAEAYFSAALAQLERLPATAKRSQSELAVLFKQGPAVVILRGLRNSDVEPIYQRAYDIAQSLADQTGLFKALWGLWFFANLSRKTDIARDRVEALVALGKQSGDDSLLLEALHCRWSTALFRGDAAGILAGVREGLELYDPVRHGRLGAEFGGHDPGVCAHSVCSMAFAQLGRSREARESIERAIELSRTLNQPPSEAFVLMNALTSCQWMGDRDGAVKLASLLNELANKFDLPAQRSIAKFMSAWAVADAGDLDGGLKSMESEFPRVSAMGPLPVYYAGLLAQAQLRAGKAASALELADDVLKAVREPGVGLYLPEIHRLRGECLLLLDRARFDEAVREFEAALAAAKQQQAWTLRLAAAVSLAQAWAGAGRPQNGRAPLQEAVDTLAEHDDVPQLASAREILSRLR